MTIDSLRKERELMGLEKYGHLDLSTDPRVFCDELQEELADGLNYLDWAFRRDELDFEDFSLVDKCLRFAYDLIEKRKKPSVRKEGQDEQSSETEGGEGKVLPVTAQAKRTGQDIAPRAREG